MPRSNDREPVAEIITVSDLTPDEVPQAADLLARAYVDNPLMYYFYGDDPQHRRYTNEVVFRYRIASMQPPALAARDAGCLVGVCGFDPPGGSQMSPDDMQAIMEAFAAVDPDAPARAMRMLADWDTRKPAEPHWHLGPVGVDPDRQGAGLGTAMMRAFCDMMDHERAVAFLETDLEQSARLYTRFGFETTEQATVYGVPVWFMTRRPRT